MRGARASAVFAIILAASSARGQSGTIAGTVVDKDRPLVGATVHIQGTDLAATTDSGGHFEFQGVAVGAHRLIWQHPSLDSLGLTMQSVEFNVPANDTVTVSLAKPSPRALFAVFCGAPIPSVIATGRVTRVDSDKPIDGATVTATWTESGPVGRTATTDSVGRYHICVAPGQAISIHAKLDADARTYLPPSPMGSVVFADLLLGAQADHASASISGRVVSDSATPISGASVTLLGTKATSTTGRDGQFSLAGLPTGTQVLIVRNVGMDPSIKAVNLSAHAPRTLTVTLQRTPPTLEKVNVVATKEQLADAYDRIGFTARKKIGMGRFLTQDEIHKNAGHTVADALNGYGGIYAGSNGDHGIFDDDVDGKNYTYSDPRVCTLYIVDGRILGENEDDYGAGLPPPNQVIGIEIYRVGQPKPIKVSFGADVCAEVLVWTKAQLKTK